MSIELRNRNVAHARGIPGPLRSSGRLDPVVLASLSILTLPMVAAAQSGRPTDAVAGPSVGVTEDLVSRYDPSQRYATFVPSSYTPARRWPVMFLMDPRGRALLPLEGLAPAAERLGYVLISSYNTLSDGPVEPNEIAIAAMIEDAQDLFAVDARRLYFVGFSGTARLTWTFAERFADYTAGLIAFGGAPSSSLQLVSLSLGPGFPFDFYGGAGMHDFNYEEMRRLDLYLDDYGAEHFLSFYEGPHAWPDSTVFTAALEWLDVRAVRRGLQTRTPPELEVAYRHALDRAATLEDAGRGADAARWYAGAVRDFEGMVDTGEAAAAYERVGGAATIARAVRRLEGTLQGRLAFDEVVNDWQDRVRESKRPEDVRRAIHDLDLHGLLERAADTSDPETSNAARRKLNSVFAITTFYGPREHGAEGRGEVVEAFYDVAAVIEPEHPSVCLGRARARARAGDAEQALVQLACVVSSGRVDAATLREDPAFEGLREDPRFGALFDRRMPDPVRR